MLGSREKCFALFFLFNGTLKLVYNLKARLLFCLLITIIDFEYKKFIDLQYKFWMNAAGNQVYLITLCHHCERQK